PRFIKALITEAKLLAKLRHKSIVQIFDFGVERGEYFLVMEYVDGEDLSAVLAWVADGHRFPVDVAAHVCAELADAVDPAHRAGLVHRAVAPTGVLFSVEGEVRVGDFGSARGDQAATNTDDVHSVGALVRKLLASEDKIPGELDRIIERAERGG